MSAEFMTDYNDDRIAAATGNMERTIQGFSSIVEYVLEIQNQYAQFPNGRAELDQMIRAAQLITNRSRDQFTEDVQAVYQGEVLGLELFNYLEPDNGIPFKGGFAQAFVKHRMDESRPKHTSHAETFSEHTVRLGELSRALRFALSPPFDERELNPLYEAFIEKQVRKFYFDDANRYLAMAGARMILLEALSPSMDITTSQALDFVGTHVKEFISFEDLEKKDIPTDDELEAFISDPIDVDWEDITPVRKKLLDKYIEACDSYQAVVDPALRTREGIARMAQTSLVEFNHQEALIEPTDIISITGEFFTVSTNDENEVDIPLYTQEMELRGLFGGIHLIEAPSYKQLQRAVAHPGRYEREATPPLILSPAIRLIDPAFIMFTGEGSEVVGNGTGALDIPLTYKSVTYMRITPETPEEA